MGEEGVIWRRMKAILLGSLVLLTCLLPGCVVEPFPPGPAYLPPPVLMPLTLNDRSSQYVGRVDETLRRSGLEPVYRGSADMRLEFSIDEGPVNVDTYLRLVDRGRVVALGQARASGPLLINRERVVQDSFYRALAQFESQLSRSRPYP